MPSLIAAALLFANSLGAFATAYALAQGNINLVTIQIAFAIDGNVSIDPGLANALAVGMFVVLIISRGVLRWGRKSCFRSRPTTVKSSHLTHVIKPFYDQLRDAGKPMMVARCAAARKLLHLAFAAVKQNEDFDPLYKQKQQKCA